MDRRSFLTGLGAGAATGVAAGVAGSALFERANSSSTDPPTAAARGRAPNVLLILVDELRQPTVFPQGVSSVDEYWNRTMPNVGQLWQHGVKFANHSTAAGACSPSRAVLATGLYTQQTWVLGTVNLASILPGFVPQLQTGFPTYGSLLKQRGYQSMYFGKWHLTDSPTLEWNYLADYGFDSYTWPDPVGHNGQGAGEDGRNGDLGDKDIADQAIGWLEQRTPSDQPWCTTVSFINPHDREYFWAGTEAPTSAQVYKEHGVIDLFNWKPVPSEANPPPAGYPALAPNWESPTTLAKNKPSTQSAFREAFTWMCGDISPDPAVTTFGVRPSPAFGGKASIPVAPYSYWSRGFDHYALVQKMVDDQIGRVLQALPDAVAKNTVVIFTSDHGEYTGAHGLPQGKATSVYEEWVHVPLIVVDGTGSIGGNVDQIRNGLTSSVDLVPMIVDLGTGDASWRSAGDDQQLYGGRHDMMAMLRSPSAGGRDFVLITGDERMPTAINTSNAPLHIAGVRTEDAKLGLYMNWSTGGTDLSEAGMEVEFYDYTTEEGRQELDSQPDAPKAVDLKRRLLGDWLPNEVRAPMPKQLAAVGEAARRRWIDYARASDGLPQEVVPQMSTAAIGGDAGA